MVTDVQYRIVINSVSLLTPQHFVKVFNLFDYLSFGLAVINRAFRVLKAIELGVTPSRMVRASQSIRNLILSIGVFVNFADLGKLRVKAKSWLLTFHHYFGQDRVVMHVIRLTVELTDLLVGERRLR